MIILSIYNRFTLKNSNLTIIYHLVKGNWKVENPMPSNKARYITFDKLRDEVKDKLRGFQEFRN